MNHFANSPFGSDTDPRNPVNLPDGVELCRVCDATKIELMANDHVCDMFGEDECDSMAAEVERQGFIDQYDEICSDCIQPYYLK